MSFSCSARRGLGNVADWGRPNKANACSPCSSPSSRGNRSIIYYCKARPRLCAYSESLSYLFPNTCATDADPCCGVTCWHDQRNMVAQAPQPTFAAFKPSAHVLLISSPQRNCVPRRLEQWWQMSNNTLHPPYTPHKNPGHGAVGHYVGSYPNTIFSTRHISDLYRSTTGRFSVRGAVRSLQHTLHMCCACGSICVRASDRCTRCFM